MKHIKFVVLVRILITMCAAWGWWGVLYPELTMTPDTYRVVSENGAVQNEDEVVELDFDSDIYRTLLQTDRSQIHFRSRLLMNITAFTERGRGIHDSGK